MLQVLGAILAGVALAAVATVGVTSMVTASPEAVEKPLHNYGTRK